MKDYIACFQVVYLETGLLVSYGTAHITKVPGVFYAQYKERVFSNQDAMMVKMADLRHNSDIRRLKGVTDKYFQFYTEIEEKLRG